MTDRATGLARATAVIVVGTAVGKVLGFARDAGFGGERGASSVAVGFVVGSVLRVALLLPDARRIGLAASHPGR